MQANGEEHFVLWLCIDEPVQCHRFGVGNDVLAITHGHLHQVLDSVDGMFVFGYGQKCIESRTVEVGQNQGGHHPDCVQQATRGVFGVAPNQSVSCEKVNRNYKFARLLVCLHCFR